MTIAALLRYVLGSIDPNLWGVAGRFDAGRAGRGLAMLGLGSLFGRVGLALGSLLALLLGNPLSGLNSAPEMLPSGWGELGQWLPQGANATLLRSTAFFDGAGGDLPIVVADLLGRWPVSALIVIACAAAAKNRGARNLLSDGVGLDDRDALRMLRDAVDPALGSDELIRRFYTRWFAIDMSVRDLFPPDMDAQRGAFAQAMTWLFGELIAQRAEEPVAFLAQLGRDHRKYGVTQRHYDSMQDALLTTLRSHLIESWDDRLAGTARDAVALIVGVMRGAADAEKGPPYCDGTVIEHIRATRDVSVVRLQLDRPLFYHPGPVRHRPGPAVAAPVALPEPGDPRRPRRRRRVPHPLGHRRHGEHRDRRRDQARRPVAAVQPARRHAHRP